MSSSVSDEDLKRILLIVSGHGFTASDYKKDFLKRRISSRMIFTKSESVREYIEILKRDKREAEMLVDNCSINVSEFFRDQQLWPRVQELLIERIRAKTEEKNACMIRVWSAACSCGEEPYTIAILASEAIRSFSDYVNVSIHATDVDLDALKRGSEGRYSEASVKNVPIHLRGKYFRKEGEVYAVSDEIRRMVRFRRHNLLTDPPLLYFDFVFCRNVLIYFSQETQKRVVEKFGASLFRGGILILGMNELMPPGISIFEPLDLKNRIYRITLN